MNKEQIINYYDECEGDYRLLWDLDRSHAMHAGFWDHSTRTLSQALRRENEVLAELARIQANDRVLDAGCGVGGSSIFLAEHIGCSVTGITLSAKQVETARRKAAQTRLSRMPEFEVMDYTSTQFPDYSFDVVWGIESICHAHDKALFVKEAARLLKPGGRIIIADGFQKGTHSEEDKKLMRRWLLGWGVDSLDTVDTFQDHLQRYGFQNATFQDVTVNVMPSAKRLYLYSWPALAISKIGEVLGRRTRNQTENLHAARCQYQALRKDLWLYGIFYAHK